MAVLDIFTLVCGLLFRLSGAGGFYWERRDNLQKGASVESRRKTIFCSLPTYFLSWWFFPWAQAKQGEYCVCCGVFLVLLCSSCSQNGATWQGLIFKWEYESYCAAWTSNTVSCPCVCSSKSLYLLQRGHSFSFPSHFFTGVFATF